MNFVAYQCRRHRNQWFASRRLLYPVVLEIKRTDVRELLKLIALFYPVVWEIKRTLRRFVYRFPFALADRDNEHDDSFVKHLLHRSIPLCPELDFVAIFCYSSFSLERPFILSQNDIIGIIDKRIKTPFALAKR